MIKIADILRDAKEFVHFSCLEQVSPTLWMVVPSADQEEWMGSHQRQQMMIAQGEFRIVYLLSVIPRLIPVGVVLYFGVRPLKLSFSCLL
jgi:hypothetical protein